MNLSLFFHKNTPQIIAVIVVFIMVGITGVAYRIYVDDQAKLQILTKQNEDSTEKMRILKNNKNLTKDQLNEYNKLLTQLIPEKEDFFSIIYALELLSQKTGFNISKYSINLSTTTSEKFGVIIEGDGDSNTFLQFLKSYPYVGGRFITNEKIEFSSDVVGKIKMALNFYAKKVPTSTQNIAAISPQDLKLMEQIRNKTTFVFKSPTSTDLDNYATKTNPF